MTTQQAGAIKMRPLEILGIGEQEEQAYRWLLDHSGATMKEFARALSFSQNRAQSLLYAIEAKGLVTHSLQRPRHYIPSPPDIALKTLSLRHQEDLQRAEGVIQELQERAVAAQSSAERKQLTELIVGRDAMRQTFQQIVSYAQHDILSLTRPPILVSRLGVTVAEDHYDQISVRARGVEIRNIVDTEFLELPFAIKRIREEMESGEDVRVVPRLLFKMILTDHLFAMIPLDLRHPEGPILLVRSEALIDALYALFEFIWERATLVTFTEGNEMKIGSRQERISEDLKKLLSLLAAGMNDKSIMYELGMSRSTYSRRIVEAMKTLNASTRFQLGWLAKEHVPAKHINENSTSQRQ